MSDPTIYESEQHLRESIDDLNDLLKDYQQTQQALDEQRAQLTDRVQGALAEYEKRTSEYEQQRDSLDERRAELNEHRRDAEQNRDWLQMQLDARLGKTPAPRVEAKTNEVEQAPSQGVVTKDQVEKLESQLSKPKRELTLDPPGGGNQSDAVDHDLKRLAEQKRERLGQASQKFNTAWDKPKGPKR